MAAKLIHAALPRSLGGMLRCSPVVTSGSAIVFGPFSCCGGCVVEVMLCRFSIDARKFPIFLGGRQVNTVWKGNCVRLGEISQTSRI